jgi:hypothetical protein
LDHPVPGGAGTHGHTANRSLHWRKPERFNNNRNSTWVFLNGLKAVNATLSLCIDKPLGNEDQEVWGPLWHTEMLQSPYDDDVPLFGAMGKTTATTDWLDTPYVRAWFRVMAQQQELAQQVYSWAQLKDLLVPILLSTTSTAASLSFWYIRDALTHRLFYERSWGTKFTTKATVNKFKLFEQQALAILRTATEFGESTSTFSQPYLFSIIQPFTKQWNTTYGLASVSNRDTLPAWVLEFATLDLPKTVSDTLPTLIRLAESAAGSPMKTKNTPVTASMSAAQMLMRQMGQNIKVISGQPPPTPPPPSRHSKRKPAPATPDRASANFSLSNGYSEEIRRKEVFSVSDSPPKQVTTTKHRSTPGFFNPTARVGCQTVSLNLEVGPTYIQQVLVGSLDSTVGWLSETLRRTSVNSPFIHQVSHKFPSDFWSHPTTLPLVKGLRSFRLDDGVDNT